MPLSADELSAITRRLSEARSGRTGDGRRELRRVARATPGGADSAGETVNLIPLADGETPKTPRATVPAVLRDVSARGLSFVFCRAMDPGEQFVAQFPRADGPAVHFLCTVVHSRPLRAGAHVVGAEFTCVVSAAA